MDNFDKILKNRVDGSTTLLICFLEFIIDTPMTAEQSRKYLKRIASEFTDMRVIQEHISVFDNRDRNQIVEISESIIEKIENSIFRISKSLELRLREIGNQLVLLTFSNSRTVEQSLIETDPDLIESIIIMESNPGGEGEQLLNNLRHHEHLEGKLRLKSDTSALSLLRSKGIDAVILGCDSYSEKLDWMINKIGSTNVISNAKESRIPVFVLTSVLKQSTDNTVSSNLLELIDLEPFYVNIMTD